MASPTVQCSGATTTSRCISRPAEYSSYLQRLLDRRPVGVVERAQDALLLRRLHVLGEIDDVVGLEVLHRRRQDVVGQLGDDLVAHALLELGQHLAVELARPRARSAPGAPAG